MAKYIKNTLGYNSLLSETLSDTLYNLNESMVEVLKTKVELKHIKSIEFEVGEPLSLIANVVLRDGRRITKTYSTHVDEGAIHLNSDFIKAYFGEEKFQEISTHLDGYSFDFDFLKKFEPELLNQLKEDYLLSCSPNIMNGAEFTDGDMEFFLNVA